MTKLQCDLRSIAIQSSPEAEDIAIGAQVLRIGIEQYDQPLFFDRLERAFGFKHDGPDRTGEVIP